MPDHDASKRFAELVCLPELTNSDRRPLGAPPLPQVSHARAQADALKQERDAAAEEARQALAQLDLVALDRQQLQAQLEEAGLIPRAASVFPVRPLLSTRFVRVSGARGQGGFRLHRAGRLVPAVWRSGQDSWQCQHLRAT